MGGPPPLALVLLLLPPSIGWVLTEPAQRWPYPSGSLDSTGLGKGLAWTEDHLFCETMMRQFEAETVTYFGTLFFTFVTCDEITDTLVRAFSSWAANHRKLSFYHVADRCAAVLALFSPGGPTHTHAWPRMLCQAHARVSTRSRTRLWLMGRCEDHKHP